ncbi:HAD-like domain-containing protein [Spinellus fusiger]|nr:HAD-like domain-containing protein [Spinellus fusiger]
MPTVAFDLLGTLLSFQCVIAQLQVTFSTELSCQHKARQFYYGWLWAGLRDYFGSSHAGRYRPLLPLLRTGLERARVVLDMDPPTHEQTEQVMEAFSRLELMETAMEALELLHHHKWDIWVLTNGSYSDTDALLKRHGLETMIGDNILSCDDLAISKPHPKVYSEYMRRAVHKTKRIENFYLVSSNAWDLAGAKNVSVRTVYLTTEEKVYSADSYDGTSPDCQGDSLLTCVQLMIQLENKRRFL